MKSPLTLLPISEDYGSMYDQFNRWEKDHKIVTMPMVRDYLFPGDYRKARLHVQCYWSWFLKCVDNKTIPYKFCVEGISAYQREYFIEAHVTSKMRFFYHFAKSLEAYEASQSTKRSQATQKQEQRSEQELPEQLVIDFNLYAILEATRDEDLNGTSEIQADSIGFIMLDDSDPEILPDLTPSIVTAPPDSFKPKTLPIWLIFILAATLIVAVAIYILLGRSE